MAIRIGKLVFKNDEILDTEYPGQDVYITLTNGNAYYVGRSEVTIVGEN